MFNKDSFLEANLLNKTAFSYQEGLFVTELTVKEQFRIEAVMLKNSVRAENSEQFSITDESYADSINLRVALGLVNESGDKVFTIEELSLVKDRKFIDAANMEIIKANEPKK